jgi:hypothetical protein
MLAASMAATPAEAVRDCRAWVDARTPLVTHGPFRLVRRVGSDADIRIQPFPSHRSVPRQARGQLVEARLATAFGAIVMQIVGSVGNGHRPDARRVHQVALQRFQVFGSRPEVALSTDYQAGIPNVTRLPRSPAADKGVAHVSAWLARTGRRGAGSTDLARGSPTGSSPPWRLKRDDVTDPARVAVAWREARSPFAQASQVTLQRAELGNP